MDKSTYFVSFSHPASKRAAGSAACIEKGPPSGNGSPFSLYYTSSYSPVQPMLCKIVKDTNERIT